MGSSLSVMTANAIQCYHCPHTSMQGIQDCSAVDGKLLECRGLYDSCYFAKGKISQTGKEMIQRGCHYDSQNGEMDTKMENARLKIIGMVCQTLIFVFANQPIVMITNSV